MKNLHSLRQCCFYYDIAEFEATAGMMQDESEFSACSKLKALLCNLNYHHIVSIVVFYLSLIFSVHVVVLVTFFLY